jgi:uncharacterized protein (TIGR03000 family)
MKAQHKWWVMAGAVATVCLCTSATAHAQYYKPAGGPYGAAAAGPYAKWSQNVGLAVYTDAVNRPVLFLSTAPGPYGNDNLPMPASADYRPYGMVTLGYGGAGYWYGYAPSFAYEYGSNRLIPVAGGYQTVYGASASSVMPEPPTPGPSLLTSSTAVLPPRSKMATVDVFVADAKAEVWFNGTKMPQMGQQRNFTTPEMEAGKQYSYEVRAKWMQNGMQYDKTRTVTVRAGEQVGITFVAEK